MYSPNCETNCSSAYLSVRLSDCHVIVFLHDFTAYILVLLMWIKVEADRLRSIYPKIPGNKLMIYTYQQFIINSDVH